MIEALENVLGLSVGDLATPFGLMLACCVVVVFVQVVAKVLCSWLDHLF